MTGISSMLVFLISSLAVCSSVANLNCSPCTCTPKNDSIIIDCGNKGLNDVPNLCQENVTEFILSKNQITHIDNCTFIRCSVLQKLNLCRNRINTLDEGAFEGLSQLRFLDLSYNNLGSKPETLNMSQLMKPLRNLEILNISINDQLSKNKYRSLTSMMFSLPKVKLNELRLSKVAWSMVFSENDITAEFLQSIKAESLTILDLSVNRIAYIPYLLISYTPNLQELNVHGNHLCIFSFILGLRHLRVLDIGEQTADLVTKRRKDRFSEDVMFSLPPLATNVSEKQDFCHTFNRRWHNTVKHEGAIQAENAENGNTFFPLPWPTNLTLLNADNVANFGSFSGRVCVCNRKFIQNVHITFSNNRLLSFIGTIDLCNPATGFHLDLSGNRINNISKDAIGKNLATAIVSVNLAHNNLGEILREGGVTLQHFPNLQFLDLTYNSIFHVSPNVLNVSVPLQLEILVLRNNYLLDIPSDISMLTNLWRLDLSNNRILYLEQDVMSQLGILIERPENLGRGFHLDLSGNPLECSCRSLHFLKWLYKFQSILSNIEETTCSLQGKQVRFSELHGNILPHLEKQCISLQWLYVIAGFLVLIAACLTISVIAYRHRWDIKYFAIRLKIRRELYAELLEEEGAFQYDAFVAYNERDLPWVENHLIPNMEEGESPFRLCFHHRDFEIGWPIEENILRSISTSRKTIIVLSRHFICSGWCKFEMHMARIHMMERGIDKLIVVLLEDVSMADMPRTLVAIMRRHTYLVWPGENMIDNVPAFWSRLRDALAKRNGNDNET